MLTKVIIAFLPLLALCAGQGTGLNNSQELDPVGTSFRIDWTVDSATSEIVLQIWARTAGWAFLSIDNAEKTLTDVILCGFDGATGQTYVNDMSATISSSGAYGALVADEVTDTVLVSGFEYPRQTVVRVTRKLDTGDSADTVIVPGPMSVSWAISDSDDINAPLTNGGLATVTFIPAI